RPLLHPALRRLRPGRRPLHLRLARPGLLWPRREALLLMVASWPRTQVGGATVTVRDEAQAQALFQERYRNTPSPLAGQIEQRVIGGDWGANGSPPKRQAHTP